jgi:hypothetical protein
MRIFVGLVVVLAIAGGTAWYFLFGQVKTLKRRGKPPAVTQNLPAEVLPAAGTSAPGDPAPSTVATPPAEPVARQVQVEPSGETVEDFPAFIEVVDGSKRYRCEYTGQFRRTKKVLVEIKTYDIASYVLEPEKGETLKLLDGLLVDGKAKVYMLRFISALRGQMIMNDIYDRINSSFDDVDVDRLQKNIDDFVSVFKSGSQKGDIVYIVWLPGGRVYSSFNQANPVPYIADDVPFARALWRIWAGPTFGDIRFNLVRRFADPPLSK